MRTAHPLAAFWRWLLVAAFLGGAGGCAGLPANTQRTASTAFGQPEATALGRLVQARRAQVQARSDSAFKLIDSVDLAYSSRLALVEQAERSLDLQYYAIHADASTETLLQAIRAAARRGVRVRILLDDFNSVGEDAQVLRLAFERNIEVRLFNPLPGPRNNLAGRVIASLHDIPRIQKRMHNKLFIADNAWGITGGRNLGDRFFGTGDKINFLDLDVMATGSVVRAMSASFDRFWNDELAYPVQSLLDPQDLDKLRALPGGGETADGSRAAPHAGSATARDPGTVLPTITADEARAARRSPLDLGTVALVWAPSAFLVDEPGKVAPGDDEADAGETVVDGLLSLMQAAQREVLIVSPYVVPGPRMMQVYRQLRERGVRVRMLTNSMASNDAPAAHAGYLRYRKDLLAAGVELHEMRADPQAVQVLSGSGVAGSKSAKSRASLHTKAVIIDGRLAVIGSMNLDLRSQKQNSEAALVIRSAALCSEVARDVEATLASAAYRLELQPGGQLAWRAPPGAPFKDGRNEPGAGAKARLVVGLLGPFAPEEML
ncbi:MAG: phospholipase D family protein [Burkholderiales bacterium]|nr:phospholipase D family protein [Burkholderiales bacterium]